MLFLLPETSAANILLRRARRLRLQTGKTSLKSQSEIDQAEMTTSEVAFDALVKPWQINFQDPAVVRLPLQLKHLPARTSNDVIAGIYDSIHSSSLRYLLFLLRVLPPRLRRHVQFHPRRIQSSLPLRHRLTTSRPSCLLRLLLLHR